MNKHSTADKQDLLLYKKELALSVGSHNVRLSVQLRNNKPRSNSLTTVVKMPDIICNDGTENAPGQQIEASNNDHCMQISNKTQANSRHDIAKWIQCNPLIIIGERGYANYYVECTMDYYIRYVNDSGHLLHFNAFEAVAREIYNTRNRVLD